MKKIYIILFFAILSTAGCSFMEEQEDFHRVVLDENVQIVHIDHSSNKVRFESADIDSLEATLLLYDNGPGIVIDRSKNKIKIRIKNDFTRLFKIGKMPELLVRIPTDFKGKVVVDGSSGSVTGRDLKTEHIEVTGSSGNVSLDFDQFHSHVRVSTTSGNVKLFLNEEKPDVNLQLSSGSGRHSVGILLEEDQRQSKGRTEGKSGSGQYDLQIKTNSGNISVQ